MSVLPLSINDYIFNKIIGRGGFATVYLVESKKYRQVFVAKVTPISYETEKDSEIDAVEAEIRALMSLSHQNIIKLYDHFTNGRNFYLILEYCPGGSLQNDSSKFTGLETNLFISYAKQILDALAFCHKKNIAHRDIKPGNILIDSYGHVKLSDFGISLTNVNDVVQTYSGSLLYEPPEIVQKKPHNPMQADIWSAGVLFAYMINGTTPWRCDSVSVLKQRICAGSYKLRSNTPKDIVDLIAKMIVVNPDNRATAEDLLKDKIFNNDVITASTHESDSDILSPRSRKKHISTNSISWKSRNKEEKPINIFKMSLLNGRSNLPKLRPRYHESRSDLILNC